METRILSDYNGRKFKMKRIRKMAVPIIETQEGVKPIVDISPIITGVREVGVLAGPDGNFAQALEWAKEHGTRLFTRAEAQYLFEISETFREAVKDTWFWVLESASVNSRLLFYAWQFYGSSGTVVDIDRDSSDGVRCVSKRELSDED